MIMSDDEKKLTAYHEAGHAIVGLSVPDHDPVHKVTIIPRGRALGVTMFLPETDRYSHSKISLESRLASLYGGRVAEELIFGDDKVTTGASNDIQRATQLARDMVTKYGLSDELGPMTYTDEEDEVFLGRSVTQHKHVSEETARKIDEVVRGVIDRAYDTAKKILTANMRQARSNGEGAAAIRDDRPRADRRDHGRPRAGSAEGLARLEADVGFRLGSARESDRRSRRAATGDVVRLSGR